MLLLIIIILFCLMLIEVFSQDVLEITWLIESIMETTVNNKVPQNYFALHILCITLSFHTQKK